MSWKATAWVKGVRGLPSYAARTLLYTLADYYDDERGYAWPSIQRLIDDCEMPERTVKWALSHLRELGFITRLQKGNQHQPSHWQLNLNIAHAQSRESATGEGANIALSGEGAISDMVKVQKPASESAIPVGTNQQEPTIEPPVHIWPEWYMALYAIKGFTVDLEHAKGWLERKGIPESRAEETAYALKGKWPPTKNARDPWATFQHWVVRPPLEGRNHGKAGGFNNSVEKFVELDARITEAHSRSGTMPEV